MTHLLVKTIVVMMVLAVAMAVTVTTTTSGSSSSQKYSFVLHPQGGKKALEELEKKFWDVSTPGNEQFRNFLSVPELCEYVKASPEVLKEARKVIAELANGQPVVVEQAVCQDMFFVTVEEDKKTQQQSLHSSNADNNFKVLLGDEKKKQSFLSKHSIIFRDAYIVKAVPRINKEQHKKKNNIKTDKKEEEKVGGQWPGMNMDVYTLRWRYNIPPPSTIPGGNNLFTNYSQAVAEFEEEQFYTSNIVAFNKKYQIPPPNLGIKGPNKGGYFGEGNLDLEYINSLAPVVKTWWVADNYFDIAQFADTLLQVTPHPSVVSISWGGGESGYEASQITADNAALLKLGALGITVVSASGDQGTGSTGVFSCGTFDPTWPASSKYVTAVGGCYTNSNASEEVGWVGSGGGFSTSVPEMPSYQQVAVEKYLNSTNVTFPPQSYWTRGGRATPDVSTLATNFEVYSYGWGVETGTSAATPTFAAVISRINIQHLMDGTGSGKLGFLNPTLYKLGRVGKDVVSGDNKSPSCSAGFEAAEGWDPVTGLGTPDYEFLLKSL